MQLLIDFDGTIVDIAPKYYFVYSAFVTRSGGAPIDRERYWRLKRSNAGDAALLQASGLTGEATGLTDFVRTHIESDDALRHDTVLPGVTDTLAELSARHDCVVLTARRNRASVVREISALGLASYFREVRCARPLDGHVDTGTKTPKTEALRGLALTSPTLIIGDSGMDVLTGRHLSLVTCAVTSGIRDEAVLRGYAPDYLVPDLTHVPRVITDIASSAWGSRRD
jgi:phosphoglycolate phosphatase-like HAD superfamily hydrolase